MKVLRPHRFPQLSQLSGGPVFAEQGGLHSPSAAEGYQHGLDKGYQEGYESGQERGYQTGLTEGHEVGRQQGLAEGRQTALAQFEGLAQPLDKALAELSRLQSDYQSALRKEVVDLVAKVAKQVIRCELTLQPTQLLALIDETLAAMPPAPDSIEIYLNPEECQRIRELAPERTETWNLIPDARLALGECRVKVGEREADAGCNQRLSACIEKVRAQLLDEEAAQPDTPTDAVAQTAAEASTPSEPVAKPKTTRSRTAKPRAATTEASSI